MVEKACRQCRFVSEGLEKCPNCTSDILTEKWSNYVYVEDPVNSEIGKSIGAKAPGKYALNIKS